MKRNALLMKAKRPVLGWYIAAFGTVVHRGTKRECRRFADATNINLTEV